MNSALAPAQQQPTSSELAAALGACRRAFVATAVFSGMSNLLMLTGALFMLEVYDRILPSRSVPTLVALLFLVAGLYAAQGMIDTIRSRILVRVGHSLDESMSGRVYDAIVRLPLKIGGKGEGTQPIRDLDNVRSFLSGSGPVAFFDLPWMPVYLAICFLFHTLIGLTALFGAIVLVTLTIVTEIKTRHPTRSAAQFAVARNALLEASRRNAEAITAMGMVGRIAKHWHELNRNFVATSGRASDVGGGLGAASKVLRLLLQSAILAVGAWLVINQQSTPGIIIADPGCAGSGASRSRNRQLARIRHRPAKLAAAIQTPRSPAAQGRSDAVKAAGALAGRSEWRGGAARRAKGGLSGS
jgi:ABC-type protease/lipase transport system fused ATPase/permease subunit